MAFSFAPQLAFLAGPLEAISAGRQYYAAGAKECSEDFRSCSGTVGAAAFIENAPHESEGVDILEELNKSNGKIQILYWLAATALVVLFGLLTSWKYVWIIGIAAGVLSTPIIKAIQKKKYNSFVEKCGKKRKND